MNTLPNEIENMIYTYYNPHEKYQKKVLKHLRKKFKKKCENCGKLNPEKKNKKCALCKKTYYCSFDCYKTHYTQHSLICSGLLDNVD